MKNHPRDLPIGAFAAAAEVNVETVRFYQRKGLLPGPGRAYGTIRRYGASDVARVKFVKSAQRLGFSLEEIKGIEAALQGYRQLTDAYLLALANRRKGVLAAFDRGVRSLAGDTFASALEIVPTR